MLTAATDDKVLPLVCGVCFGMPTVMTAAESLGALFLVTLPTATTAIVPEGPAQADNSVTAMPVQSERQVAFKQDMFHTPASLITQ